LASAISQYATSPILNPVSDWQKLQGVLLATTAPSRNGWALLQADFKRENLLGTRQSGKTLHLILVDEKEGGKFWCAVWITIQRKQDLFQKQNP
jgi:hypothetical protein